MISKKKKRKIKLGVFVLGQFGPYETVVLDLYANKLRSISPYLLEAPSADTPKSPEP